MIKTFADVSYKRGSVDAYNEAIKTVKGKK